MYELRVGVGYVRLHLRFAQTLKDRRKVVQSLTQKLRNEGFSVVDLAGEDPSPKFAGIGFSYVGRSGGHVEDVLQSAERIFIGDFEIVDARREVFDFSREEEVPTPSEEEEKYDP